jgi:hypothetical protein
VSSRGHGGHGRPGSPARFLWMLPVIAAALIGGLAAAALVHVSLAIAVAVSVAVAVIAIFAAYRWPGRPAAQPYPGNLTVPPNAPNAPNPPSPPETPDPLNPSSPPNPARLASTMPPAPLAAHPVVQLLPASPGGPVSRGAEAPWWDAAQGGPPAPSQAARRVPAPDLSSYLSSTIIAQCPNCGAFRLDFRRAANGWDFRCESCRYTWSWQPGTHWPPVRVAPGRRRELHP